MNRQSHYNILIAIRCLNLLFYNFQVEDIKKMSTNRFAKQIFSEAWNMTALNVEDPTAYLWQVFHEGDVNTQEFILEYALNKYRNEAQEAFS